MHLYLYLMGPDSQGITGQAFDVADGQLCAAPIEDAVGS